MELTTFTTKLRQAARQAQAELLKQATKTGDTFMYPLSFDFDQYFNLQILIERWTSPFLSNVFAMHRNDPNYANVEKVVNYMINPTTKYTMQNFLNDAISPLNEMHPTSANDLQQATWDGFQRAYYQLKEVLH